MRGVAIQMVSHYSYCIATMTRSLWLLKGVIKIYPGILQIRIIKDIMTRSECSRRANWTPSQTMSRGHSQMDRSLMKNSALSSMRPKNIPRWRQRSALEHRKLMLQSLSMRRQKTSSSNRAETRPGRVSWRSWLGPELCVPKEHLDAGMLLRMRQRKRKEWPAPMEPLGRRGGGPSSQGLLVVFPVYTLGILWVYTWLSLVWGPARGVGRALPG